MEKFANNGKYIQFLHLLRAGCHLKDPPSSVSKTNFEYLLIYFCGDETIVPVKVRNFN